MRKGLNKKETAMLKQMAYFSGTADLENICRTEPWNATIGSLLKKEIFKSDGRKDIWFLTDKGILIAKMLKAIP